MDDYQHDCQHDIIYDAYYDIIIETEQMSTTNLQSAHSAKLATRRCNEFSLTITLGKFSFQMARRIGGILGGGAEDQRAAGASRAEA